MFSAKQGFILSDALVSVLIVSVMAIMTVSAAALSIHNREAVAETFEEMESRYETGFLSEEACDCIWEEETDPS